MPTPIKLTGEQLCEVSIVSENNPYKNGQRAKDKKTYSQFKFESTVFTVPSDNPFCKAFNDGEVKSIKLMDGTRDVSNVDESGNETITQVRQLEFDSFVSRAQYNNLQADRVLDASVEYKIKRFEHLATAPITNDLLAELENA
jgi:hypothetical protein